MKNSRVSSTILSLVSKRGFEPPRAYAHYPLKVARLPVPPLGHAGLDYTYFSFSSEDSSSFSSSAGTSSVGSSS